MLGAGTLFSGHSCVSDTLPRDPPLTGLGSDPFVPTYGLRFGLPWLVDLFFFFCCCSVDLQTQQLQPVLTQRM